MPATKKEKCRGSSPRRYSVAITSPCAPNEIGAFLCPNQAKTRKKTAKVKKKQEKSQEKTRKSSIFA
jgi:hypothetical protein